MNEVIKAIKNRRSVRAFTEKFIPADALEEIADCARYAPSGMNSQLWHFTIVSNAAYIKKLYTAVGGKIEQEGYNFYKPTALIICSAENGYRFAETDIACAMENIFLAAYSLGIGSVWINQLGAVCDDSDIRKILNDIGVPANYTVHATAALGYAAVNLPARAEKKKIREIVNFVR